MIYKTEIPSPLGTLILAADAEGLCGLWLPAQKQFTDALLKEVERKDNLPVFARTRAWLDRYFKGKAPSPDELPLHPVGTAFQQQVWAVLRTIPYGETTTYSAVAEKISLSQGGKKGSSRAVGGAVGRNPISIIIPCHRVVGKSGSLTGYAGGIAAKKYLLSLEGVDIDKFTDPR